MALSLSDGDTKLSEVTAVKGLSKVIYFHYKTVAQAVCINSNKNLHFHLISICLFLGCVMKQARKDLFNFLEKKNVDFGIAQHCA